MHRQEILGITRISNYFQTLKTNLTYAKVCQQFKKFTTYRGLTTRENSSSGFPVIIQYFIQTTGRFK